MAKNTAKPAKSRRSTGLAGTYRVRSVGPGTLVYGLLGHDVLRSLSPAIHNRAFAERGIDAVYVPLQAESLDAFLEARPRLALSGFSAGTIFTLLTPFATHVGPWGR